MQLRGMPTAKILKQSVVINILSSSDPALRNRSEVISTEKIHIAIDKGTVIAIIATSVIQKR